jgi:hypothetical protein
MRKTIIGCVILCAVFLAPAMNLHAVMASINSQNWMSTIVRNGYDEFYGTYVTAYEEGRTARLAVNVYNDYYVQANVSAVKVGFDWGSNYTSSECSMNTPSVISVYQSHIFIVEFQVPPVSSASNLVTHGYTIYVELVNSTSGNKRIMDTWTQSGSNFAVFSSDQAEAYAYKQEIEAYPSTSSGIPFLTAEARELIVRSSVAKSMGNHYYVLGDFNSSKTYYKDSLDFMQQAWSNETEKWSTFENSFADLLKGAGNLLMFQGYAWLIFAFGFLLMSVGVLVYLVRKRPVPKPA